MTPTLAALVTAVALGRLSETLSKVMALNPLDAQVMAEVLS